MINWTAIVIIALMFCVTAMFWKTVDFAETKMKEDNLTESLKMRYEQEAKNE